MDPSYLFLVMFFSSVGLAYFIYGKKQSAFAPLLSGLALMAYPFFVSSTFPLVSIGLVLAAIPWFIRV